MPHVILKGRGWEGFDGLLGQHMFEEGRSVENLPQLEASRLAAFMKVETEDGEDPSPAQEIINTRNKRASTERSTQKLVRDKSEVKAPEKAPETAPASPVYNREQLEALADKQGLNGLREVAKEFKVTDKSIAGLIDKILEKCEAK